MQISLTAVLLLAASSFALPSPQEPQEEVEVEVSQDNAVDALQDLTNQAMAALQDQESDPTVSKRSNQCSLFSAHVRRDWFVHPSSLPNGL